MADQSTYHIKFSPRLRKACDTLLVLSPLLILFACIETFNPKLESGDLDILVVNGFLDSSDSTAVVKLSRSLTLGGDTTHRPVEGALVIIESDDGSSFDLSEQLPGRYELEKIPVYLGRQYKVHIISENKEYVSDYTAVKPTPTIDSISWRPVDNATNTGIFVNAHDDSDKTRYYKWDFVETFEYDATLESKVKVVNRKPVPRELDEYVFTCWKTTTSTKIYVGSTVQLQKDVIRDYPLIKIPRGSLLLSKKYSILVRQRALSEREFNFLDQLQKTTEGIGGLFDPQPSQIAGNIHNITDGAQVLGMFSVGNTTSKRIYIEFGQLPTSVRVILRETCPVDTICVGAFRYNICIKNVDALNGSETILQDRGAYLTATTPICGDCRKLAGGVTKKPAFWE